MNVFLVFSIGFGIYKRIIVIEYIFFFFNLEINFVGRFFII